MMGPGGPGGVDELIGLGFLLVERSESTEKVSVRRIKYHVTCTGVRSISERSLNEY